MTLEHTPEPPEAARKTPLAMILAVCAAIAAALLAFTGALTTTDHAPDYMPPDARSTAKAYEEARTFDAMTATAVADRSPR